MSSQKNAQKNAVNASIEARMTSSRLPGKVLMKAGGKPLLQILLERLKTCKSLNQIIVATTINAQDNPIVELCEKLEVPYLRGSEDNVLERVVRAHQKIDTDIIVEITGDCPLMDPALVDNAVEIFKKSYPEHKYVSNTGVNPTVPNGFDIQIFKLKDLEDVLQVPSFAEREHVSCRFYDPKYSKKYNPLSITGPEGSRRPELFATLDYKEDFELIKKCYEDLSQKKDFGILDVINWIDRNPSFQKKCIDVRKGS
jgi:spore coat polysaccharide biosynthesis protein SpsF